MRYIIIPDSDIDRRFELNKKARELLYQGIAFRYDGWSEGRPELRPLDFNAEVRWLESMLLEKETIKEIHAIGDGLMFAKFAIEKGVLPEVKIIQYD